MNGQEFHFFIVRRSLSSSSAAIGWKKKQTKAVLFILRILLGTRAYFSNGIVIAESCGRDNWSSRCDSYVTAGRKYLWRKHRVSLKDLISKRAVRSKKWPKEKCFWDTRSAKRSLWRGAATSFLPSARLARITVDRWRKDCWSIVQCVVRGITRVLICAPAKRLRHQL